MSRSQRAGGTLAGVADASGTGAGRVRPQQERNVGGFAPVAAVSLSDRVARAVVASIVRGDVGPGDPLPTSAEMARQFQVSKPVLREALREVATLGLLRSWQGRRTVVAPKSGCHDLAPQVVSVRVEVGAVNDILADALELRRAIEPEAAALAAGRATSADLHTMRRSLEALEATLGDTLSFMSNDIAFHDAILRATNNRLFLQLTDQLREVLAVARASSVTSQPERRRRSQACHWAVFRAIEAGHADEARAAMADHLSWADRVNVADRRTGVVGTVSG